MSLNKWLCLVYDPFLTTKLLGMENAMKKNQMR